MEQGRTLLTIALSALMHAPPAAAEPIPAGGYLSPEKYPGMQLVWREEFAVPQLDETNWIHETGFGTDDRETGELQYHQAANTEVRDGYLVVYARREQRSGVQYTSSRLSSLQGQVLTDGRVDVRVSLPEGRGIRPALRLRATRGEPGAEMGIDIVEMIGGSGREDTVYGTLNWRENGKTRYEGGSMTLPNDTFTGQFHVFSIVLNASEVRWLADDREYYRQDLPDGGSRALQTPLHFVVSLAVGGDWPGRPDETTRFPQRLIVDYIRVFHKSP